MRSAHDISYDEWIDDVFVHAYPRFAGVEHEDDSNSASIIEADAAANLQFLARLFRESGALLNRYTPDQIGLGFNYLIFNACSNNAFVLTDLSLPLDQRVACVLSIADVYRDCFQQICKPYLGTDSAMGIIIQIPMKRTVCATCGGISCRSEARCLRGIVGRRQMRRKRIHICA